MDIESMINKDGTKKYAYVMLLMIDEKYVPASIVLAESLKKIGCLADLVVMIDENINDKTVDLLKMFYDKIVKVEKIFSQSPDPIQKYLITKIQGLKLTEYEKIALIDVDSIILSHPNKIFTYQPPSGQYISNILSTGIILLKPSITDFDKLLIKSKEISKEITKPLVYLLQEFYKDFNQIDPLILKSNDYDYEDTYGIQYNKNKPFILKSSIPIETRSKWKHFRLWFMYFRNILNDYPDIVNYRCLDEVIDLLKYYLAPLSRFMVEERHKKQKIKKEQIKELYGLSPEKNLDYYHLDLSREYHSDDLVYLINDYSIGAFIEYLKNKTNILTDMKLTSVININDILKQVDSTVILDYLLSEYIKIFPNVYIILLVNESSEPKTKLTKQLKQNLFFKKEFNFMGLVLKSILFNVYQENVYQERLYELGIFADYETYRVQLLFYQSIHPLNLSLPNDNRKIFIFDDTNSKVRLGSIFLNRNTLNRYQKEKIKLVSNNQIKRKELKSILNFQSIKKWLYNNYSGNQLDNCVIIKSKPLTILDLNFYTKSEGKKLLEKEIELFKLINSSSKSYLKSKKKFDLIKEKLLDPNNYWIYEGIKVLIK